MKLRIQKYDPACKKAPFTFITLKEVEIEDSFFETLEKYDNLGEMKAEFFRRVCSKDNYFFKFYSIGQKPNSLDITVY